MNDILYLLESINDVVAAGAAIITSSLFIYVLTYKLKDRATWSYTFLLGCLVVIFGSDAFFSVLKSEKQLLFLLRIQYIGLIFLPVSYFNFSDALLAMTGKPSRGKRKIVFYSSLILAIIFLGLNFAGILFSEVDIYGSPAPHIERTITHDLFSIFFFILLVLSWYNFIRSGLRTKIRTSRRRMVYLIISAIGPAFGSFPFLLYGYEVAAENSAVFWMISIITMVLVIISSIGMTTSF